MGVYQTVSRSKCIDQLTMADNIDPRQTLLYNLSKDESFENFKRILIYGSKQDKYVPFESALCLIDGGNTQSKNERAVDGYNDGKVANDQIWSLSQIQAEMSRNINEIISRVPVVRRFEVEFPLMDTADKIGTIMSSDILGRLAHVAMLDNALMIDMQILTCNLHFLSSRNDSRESSIIDS